MLISGNVTPPFSFRMYERKLKEGSFLMNNLMITGPCLCLALTALRSRDWPRLDIVNNGRNDKSEPESQWLTAP